MARQVVRSLRAQSDRKQILEYWRHRNKSSAYSKKLNQLFKDSIRIIRDFPQVDKITDQPNTRIKIVRDSNLRGDGNSTFYSHHLGQSTGPQKIKKAFVVRPTTNKMYKKWR